MWVVPNLQNFNVSSTNNPKLANGLNLIDTNKLSIATNNINRLNVDSTGNVGIGNEFPAYKLDVNGSFRSVGNAIFSNDVNISGNLDISGLTSSGITNLNNDVNITGNLDNTGTATFQSDIGVSGTSYFSSVSANSVNITGNADISGDVGIGITTSPLYALEIRKTSAMLVPKGSTAQRPNIEDGLFRYNTTLTQFEGYSNGSWAPIGGGAADLDGDTYIQAETSVGANNNELEFFTAGNRRMLIGNTGNIDINENLTIGGNLIVQGTTTSIDSITLTVDDPMIRLADNNPADITDIGFYGMYVDTGTTYYRGLIHDASDSAWKLFNAETNEPGETLSNITNPLMTILDSGNVGIGITNPTYKLVVSDDVNTNSTVRFDNLNSGASAFSQFVVGSDNALAIVDAFSSGYSGSGSTQADAVLFGASNNTGGLHIVSGAPSSYTAFHVGSFDNEHMRITDGGNVGIGTDNPTNNIELAKGSHVINDAGYHAAKTIYRETFPNDSAVGDIGTWTTSGNVTFTGNYAGETQVRMDTSGQLISPELTDLELYWKYFTDGSWTSNESYTASRVIMKTIVQISGMESGENCFIELSTDNGSSWIVMWKSTLHISTQSYHPAVVDITNYIVDGVQIKFRFRTTGTGAGDVFFMSHFGIYVDDSNSWYRFGAHHANFSGNVGIGTTNPAWDLSLYKADSNDMYIQFANTTTGATTGDGFIVGIDTSEIATIRNRENTDMTFFTNDTERIRINSSGQTQFFYDASYDLWNGGSLSNVNTIFGNRNTNSQDTRIFIVGERTGQSTSGIVIGNRDNTDATDSTNPQVSCAFYGQNASDQQSGDAIISTSSDGQTLTERLRITSDGNVGIGDTNPNAPLQFDNVIGNRKIVLYDTNNNDHEFYGFGINPFVLRYQTTSSSADHIFYSGIDDSSSLELMRIAGDGYVSIGGNQAVFKLRVADDTEDILGIFNSGGGTDNAFITIGDSNSRFRMGYTEDNSLLSNDIRAEITIDTTGRLKYSSRTSATSSHRFYVPNGTTATQRIEFSNTSPYAFKTSGGSWGTLSDIRIKKNFREIANPLEKICALQPKHFEFINQDVNPQGTRTGFIAQEFEQVFPGHISEIEAMTPEDQELLGEGEKVKAIDADLIPYIVSAFKDLVNKIKTATSLEDLQNNLPNIA